MGNKALIKENDTDLFPNPFELNIIQDMEEELIAVLIAMDLSVYKWNTARRFLIPKDNISFRNATQLHPIDSIVLSAILYEYGRLIEVKRQPENIVFSYRFKPLPDGTMYANKTAWDDFWKACQNEILVSEDDEDIILEDYYGYVVTCDISDFYNQIYLHTIENQLVNCGLPNQIQKRIKELITQLNVSNSRGIPIGPHSTHLLAEMSLIPVDESLALQGIKFFRYVDDFVFFCHDQKEARITIQKIAEILDKEQRLVLQRQKTQIFKVKDFYSYTKKVLIEDPAFDSESEIIEIIRSYTGNSPYTRISLGVISNEDLAKLSNDNIVNLLSDYLKDENYEKLRWLYRRLSQIGIPHAIDFSLENFNDLIPALNDICLYINSCAENYSSDWKDIGEIIIELLQEEIIKSNPFYQITLLQLFVHNKKLNHFNQLVDIYKTADDDVKRKILLSSLHYNNASWIYQLKEQRFGEWALRAYVIATKSLPPDQKKFLHGNIRSKLHANNLLEHLILKWAK